MYGVLSLSILLASTDSFAIVSKLAIYSVIFLLTSCFVVPEKLFRFRSPDSSIYQTVPPQRLSVRLKALPLVSNFLIAICHHVFSPNTIPQKIKYIQWLVELLSEKYQLICKPLFRSDVGNQSYNRCGSSLPLSLFLQSFALFFC